MKPTLAREVDAIQNPALGSALLWRFAVGYADSRQSPQSTPLPVLFLPLPVLFHEETLALVTKTQTGSGLRAFTGKFSDSSVSESDVLLSLERRARSLRPLSLCSLQLAVASRLLFVDRFTAEVVALSDTSPKTMPESVRPLIRAAEKLGKWCGEVTLFELSNLLRVGL